MEFLTGLLFELKEHLCELKIIKNEEVPLIDNIRGMQWLIRGEKLDIRKIKSRLNNSLLLYESLVKNFSVDRISFEKCAVATFLVSEYEDDFYEIEDRFFDDIIEKQIMGTLDVDSEDSNFKKNVIELIKSKLIDADYRTYFYHYPKESKLYSVSELHIYNSLLYKTRPSTEKEFEMHLSKTSDLVIDDAYNKIKQLNIIFPSFIFEYEKLCFVAVDNYGGEVIRTISDFKYEDSNKEKYISIFKKVVSYHSIVNNHTFMKNMAEELNRCVIDKKILCEIRKSMVTSNPNCVNDLNVLFMDDNMFITKEEINSLKNVYVILELINYQNADDVFAQFVSIHDLLMKTKNIEVNKCLSMYLHLFDLFELNKIIDMVISFCKYVKEIPKELINKFVSCISEGLLKANKYIDLIVNTNYINDDVIDSLITINWIDGLPENICEEFATRDEWLMFVCNTNVSKLNYENSNIITTINEHSDWIYTNAKDKWMMIRSNIVCRNGLITKYSQVFNPEYPIISFSELNCIKKVDDAIFVLKQQDISIDLSKQIAKYFNQKYRNNTESYHIYQFILSLESEICESIFYDLDIGKNIQFNNMSKVRKNSVSNDLINLLEIDTAEKKIRFMNHIGCSISKLEKDLHVELNKDDSLREMYVEYVNSLDEVTTYVMSNITKFKTIDPYNEKINQKLYEMKNYVFYVSSTTAYNNKFEIEEDKKEILWDTYVYMFNSTSYDRTRNKMKQNDIFMNELISKQTYKLENAQIMNYTNARQDKEILEYIFIHLNDKELVKYLSAIKGFDSYEAAKCFVDKIIEIPSLLGDDNIYENTYDKLINGPLKGKYTKARKK